MRIAVTGSTGLIGSVLVETLRESGFDVVRLVRGKSAGEGEILWNPDKDTLDPAPLEGIDGVVHLAGESVMGRWTEAKKQKILESRVRGTALLARTLASLAKPPSVFVSGSAIGFYGDRGDTIVDETAPKGTGFLADVCDQWEKATAPASEKGIRTVRLRIGVVLSGRGGALKNMLLPFKLGLGGVLGSGQQFMSWISIHDVVGAIKHALLFHGISGAVNAVAPHPVTNRTFTKMLGSVLGRPTIFPMPAFAARKIFGELADDLLLSSTRAVPQKLLATAYPFEFHDLRWGLAHAVKER